ncbi:MAG: hypothetical protein WBY53_17325 [Acidobacteriaceae bacterium]
MPVFCGAAVVLLQSSELTRHDIHWAMIFLAIIAIALIVQAVGVLISSAFGAKLLHRVNSIADIVETKTGPILDRTDKILKELEPKVRNVGDQVEHVTTTVRAKVDELGETMTELNDTMREINGKTRAQVKRVDGIVTDALQTTEEVSQTIQNGIKGPVKQIAGIIAGLRAGIETLIERSPFKGRG